MSLLWKNGRVWKYGNGEKKIYKKKKKKNIVNEGSETTIHAMAGENGENESITFGPYWVRQFK